MKRIIFFICLLGLTGCGFVFKNFDQNEHEELTYGMSKEEVIAKIGKPQKISRMVIDNKEYEVLEYPDNNRPKEDKMKKLGVVYSEMFFLDGKLVKRDKNRVYAQPGYEFLEFIDPEEEKMNETETKKNNDTAVTGGNPSN